MFNFKRTCALCMFNSMCFEIKGRLTFTIPHDEEETWNWSNKKYGWSLLQRIWGPMHSCFYYVKQKHVEIHKHTACSMDFYNMSTNLHKWGLHFLPFFFWPALILLVARTGLWVKLPSLCRWMLFFSTGKTHFSREIRRKKCISLVKST